MLKYLIIVVACCQSLLLFGQENAATKIFEGYYDYPLPDDEGRKSFIYDQMPYNYYRAIKLLFARSVVASESEYYKANEAWSFWIHKGIMDLDEPIYSTENLANPISKEFVSTNDTVSVCWPDHNYDGPGYKIVANEMTNDQLIAIRLKQTLFWHPVDGRLSLHANAFAALEPEYDENGNYHTTNVLGWLSLRPSKTSVQQTLSDNNVPFVAHTSTYLFSAYDSINVMDAALMREVIKKTLLNAPPNSILSSYNLILNKEQRQAIIGPQRDSTLHFDVETDEEKYIYTEQPFDWSTIEDIRLDIRWHWNAEENGLYYELVSWSPLISVYDENNYLQYRWPLFYRLTLPE